jgi:hypothetical protein
MTRAAFTIVALLPYAVAIPLFSRFGNFVHPFP